MGYAKSEQLHTFGDFVELRLTAGYMMHVTWLASSFEGSSRARPRWCSQAHTNLRSDSGMYMNQAASKRYSALSKTGNDEEINVGFRSLGVPPVLGTVEIPDG